MSIDILPDEQSGTTKVRGRFLSGRALVAIATAVTLLAGVAVVLTHKKHKDLAWDPRVLPIVHFVEQTRGLRFKQPVPVEFLPDKDFENHVTSSPKEDKKDAKKLEEAVGRLRALALLRGKVDLKQAEKDLLGSSIVGLYVPKDKRVFVRGAQLTPYVRTTLAHELTHVLQDQYFNLVKLQDVTDATAVTALIEGDANRIEEAYKKALSSGDKTAYDRETTRLQASVKNRTVDVPQVLTDSLSFPYVFGPVFLDSLPTNEDINKAFRHPPSAEAQILDPVGHPYSTNPVSVPDPVLPTGAVKFGDTGPFGQVFLLEVLGSRLPYDVAYRAVAGWTGDTSVGYRVGGVACNAADVRTTSVQDLAAAARTWAAFIPGATVTVSGDTVSLRSCDPGKAARSGERTPSAFAVLSVRASLIHAFVMQGATLTVSACTTDKVLAGYASGGYAVLTKDKLSDAETTTLRAHIVAAVASCR